LSLTSGSGAPGSVVTVDLMLADSAIQPSALQWTVNYATKDISALNVNGSTSASLSCKNGTGTATCALFSMNSNTISQGVVATLAFTIASSTTDTSSAIQLAAGDAVSLSGSSIPTSMTGSTLTLNITPAPAITSPTTGGGTVGTAFSYQIAATNSPTSYGATGLPAGLSINTSTGLISGAPTTAGTSTLTLSAKNSSGTGTASLTLTIVSAIPAITSPSTGGGTVGTAFSYQIAATNSPTSYGATGLPAGLSINTSTGLISGTPTTAGTSTVTLSAKNSSGTGTATLTLTIVSSVPAITSPSTGGGTVGTAFSYQISATSSPTSYAATGLPAGLSINTSTGLISGTPTAAGTSTVALSAVNSSGTGKATLTLTIVSNSNSSPVSIKFVQATANAASANASSLSVALPSNTHAGDLILVGFDFANNAATPSITDSQGNTFTQVGTQMTSPAGAGSRLYFAKNIKGGTDTVKVTLSASSSYLEMYLTEYSGADPNNPIDVQAESSGAAGAVSSGAATTTVAGDVIYGYCAGDAACTVGSGFVARSTLNSNLVEDKTASTVGSYAATGSANSGWTMHMAALRPVSSNPPPVISSASAASGTVGTALSYQIAASNSPTSYNATGLPAGLSVSTSTGLISGTPTAAGTSTVTLSATNSGGTGSATLTLTITPPAPGITSATTASGNVGTAFTYQIAASNSPTSYGASGLPAGLSVNTSTGLISGTPTAAGTSSVTLTATNSGGSGHAVLTLTIASSTSTPPAITSSTTASGTVGTAFSYQIAASNSPTSYAATGLPAGLSVNTSTGLISGTPTAAGTSSVTLTATNSSGSGSAVLTLTISPAVSTTPSITSATTAKATVSRQFSYQIAATNSPTSYNATGLPAGLSINTKTGLISGTPTTTGVYTVTLDATNSSGTGTATLTITVARKLR